MRASCCSPFRSLRTSLLTASLVAAAFVGSAPSLRAVNTIPTADVSGNWLTVPWGASGGVNFGVPGNNDTNPNDLITVDDSVYIRRNNTITIDSDVSPSALGFPGGLNSLTVGDGFDGPARGSGTLIMTGGGRLRMERAPDPQTTLRSLVNVSLVNPNRDRPNSVGTILLEGNAELSGATLNVGVTTIAYTSSYLATHTVPSSGTFKLSDNASATFASLVLGTAATRNAGNTAAGFPATTGSLELVGGSVALNVSGAVTFNNSGTLKFTASAAALPQLSFPGTVATETGFTFRVDLAAYDVTSLLQENTPRTLPLIAFADSATAAAFLSAANVQIVGHDAAKLTPTVALVDGTVTLTLAPYQPVASTGIGVQISRQPTPSTLDVLLGNDIYIADPAIVVAPDGSYLIAHSIFGDGTDQANLTTKVFRSTDRGATWTQVATMTRLQRANFFVHDGAVYCLGTGRIDGSDSTHLVIRKSTDNGLTWTAGPATASDPGYLRSGGTGTPSTPVIHNGRVWMARATLGLSGDLAQDLMTPAAWTVHSNPQALPDTDPRPAYRDAWPAYNDQTFALWSESQIVASPQTGVVLMPKIELQPVAKGTTSVPHYAHIPHISLQTVASATSSLAIDPATTFVPLPGTQKKFGATYDPATQKFYALTNTVLPAFETHEDAKHQGYYKPQLTRNTGTLFSSRDLVHWDLEKIFIHSDNVAHHAWQYFNFVVDQDDLLVASRTAFKTAQDTYDTPRGHDSNLLTFHRISNYASLIVTHTLAIENGTVKRYEPTDYQPAPLGNFALGVSPQDAVTLGETPERTIVIQRQGGQLYHYDAQGNYLGTLAQLPSGTTLSAGPINVVQTRTAQRTYTQPGSGAWYDPRNWHYWGIPDTAAETVTLGSAATGAASLTLDRPTTLNALTFRSTQPYTIAAGSISATDGTLYHRGSLTLAPHTDTAAAPALHNLQGHHAIAVPLTVPAGTTLNLAAGTTLSLATLTLAGDTTLNIDLTGFSATPPLTIQTLARTGSTAKLALRLTNAPAVSVSTPIISVAQFSNLTAEDISVTALDGTRLPFALVAGALTLEPPPPAIVFVNEYPTPADTHALSWFGSSSLYIDRNSPPGIKIVGPHTEGGTNSGLHHALAYFASPAKPFVLNVGHAITLTAKITPTSTTSLAGSNALRFGLFNTRNRAADIIAADAAAATNLSTGYMIGLTTNASAAGTLIAYNRSPDALYASDSAKIYNLITHSTAFQSLGSNVSMVPGKLTKDQTYTLRLTVTRTATSSIRLEGSISGGDLTTPATVTANDTNTINRDGAICTRFDTIAFAAANNAGLDDLRITDITVSTPQSLGEPTVVVPPADRDLPHDSTLTLSVLANGAAPIAYQWNFNGSPIPDATAATLTIEHATDILHSGNYTCTLTNAYGTTTSQPAIVNILPSPVGTQVFVDEYPAGTAARHLTWHGSTTNVVGTTATALQLRGNLGNGAAAPTGLRHILTHFADTAHPVAIANGQTITVSLKLTPTVTTELTSGNALRIALLNTFNRPENIISADSNPGGVTAAGYAAYFHSNTGGLSHAARRFTPPPSEDEDAIYVSSIYLNYSYPYQTLATRSGLVSGNILKKDLTYELTHSITRVNDTTLTLTTTISGGDLPSPASLITTETAAINNRDGYVITEFDTLAIAASGNGGLDTLNLTDIQVLIPEQPGAPYIHVQPANQRVLAGQPAALYVNASGRLPLSYQWRKDGADLPGATSQTYALASATLADDSNRYTCVITNADGSTESQPAQIAIRTAATIVAPTPASYLASHMVLQRNKPNTIWGVANPGDTVSVSLVNTATTATVASGNTVADANGNFLVVLPALPHSATPHELRLANALDTTTLTDILIGENWLCGGQSNMAWSVGSSDNAAAEIADSVNYPLIRFYRSTLSGSVTPQENNTGTWKTNTPANVRNMTGAGYFMVRSLAQTVLQGVPIGLIDVSRGGSSIDAWMERETLRRLGYTTYADATGDDTHSGAALYNAMIHPVRHASLAGIAWYQGEHNSTSYAQTVEYRQLFPQLIDHWRDDVFRQPDLPFHFVLLANFIRTVDTTGEGWAWGRYAQLQGLSRPHTAFTAAHDIGDYFDTHPRNKQDVGYRLALNALKHHYGYANLEDTGPTLASATTAPGTSTVTLTFTHAQGLVLDITRRRIFEPDATRNIPNGYTCPDFELAGADGVWHPASASIAGNEGGTGTVIVSSAAVPAPVKVRYAWNNGPSTILFNTAMHPVTGAAYALPATPFLQDVTLVDPPFDPRTLSADELLVYALSETMEPGGSSAHLPQVGLSANGKLTLSFTRLRSDVDYTVQASTDLVEWTTVAVNPGVVGEQVLVEDLLLSGATRRFLRLKITVP